LSTKRIKETFIRESETYYQPRGLKKRNHEKLLGDRLWFLGGKRRIDSKQPMFLLLVVTKTTFTGLQPYIILYSTSDLQVPESNGSEK
jgi:hypothetical protein